MTDLMVSGTGQRGVFAELPQTRRSAYFVDQIGVLHRQVRDLHESSASMRRDALVEDLDARQQEAAARDGVELLSVLSDSGLAWRDVAKLAGVTVPAVQKWRRGEGMSGARRLALARIVAMLDILGEHFVSDPASWLEMPVKDGVAISRLQLLAQGRFDLVLLLIADDTAPAVEVDRILDEYDADWRSTLIDDQFESFLASDGVVSIKVAAQA
ncbi:transcriptional regulator [Microbacterium sp. BK668]|uniref:transcriptional regulator n=1 Tax=Microbacterium sp. BK668 TaxID=2512118 RepID=UPI001061049B|nr:transcriptional regulator [Microbacterium sp. BK668]